jgi:hypothetical protein
MFKAGSKIGVGVRLAVILLAAAALAGSAGAKVRGGSSDDGVAVPLRGVEESVETQDVDFPTLLVDGTGGGTAAHLGRYTFTYEFTVDLTTGVGVGSAHFVAANGDTFDTTILAGGGPTGVPGENRVVETHTITGGTGRFAGASGTFTLDRLVQMATTASTGSLEGTIVLAK